ncbi:hypothetical protein LCGC14_1692900 [marine sediment metagenome]|uniref:Uncharacterized protein n=1 Tax=marine sediment metagenome TaxID=412755 RepID=A0A0F9HK75_9ZZZZ
MASPYNPGLNNATALGLAMGAEAAGVTAGVVNALALGAAMGATGAGTTAGVKAALLFGALFTEGPTVTIVTSEATDVTVANPFAATVNFLIATSNKVNNTNALHLTTNVQTTLVIDVGAATTWSGSYVIGVVA